MADETLVLQVKIDATQSAKTIADLTKRNRELAKVLRNAPREGQEGFEQLNKELKEAREEYARNREEINKFNRELRETAVASDSLKGLSRQLRDLEKEYKELSAAQRDAIGGRDLQKRIRSTRAELKRLESDIGDNRRRVGEYGAAWAGASANIARLGRTAQRTLSAVRFLSIGSFQALFDGVQLVSDGIRNLTSLFDANFAIQQRVNKISGDVAESFVEERINLQALIEAGDESNGTTTEAVAARQALIDQYGDLLTKEEQNAILLGKTKDNTEALTRALIENLAVSAQREVLQDLIKEIAQSEVDLLATQQNAETQAGQFADLITGQVGEAINRTTGGLVELNTEASKIQEATARAQQQSIERQIENIDQVGDRVRQVLGRVNEVIQDNLGKGVTEGAKTAEGVVNDFTTNSAKNVTVLDGSLADLRQQLSAVNKAINETVQAGDAGALVPLIDQAKALEDQIKTAENVIKDLRGELEETAEEQAKRLEKQSQLLIQLNADRQQAQLDQAQARKDARDAEINEIIRDEETRTNALLRSEEILQQQQAEIKKRFADEELKANRDLVAEVTDETLAQTQLRLSEERKAKLSADEVTNEQRAQIEKDFQRQLLEAQVQALRERLVLVDAGSKEEIAIRQQIIDAELQLLGRQAEEEERIRQEEIQKAKAAEDEKLSLREAAIKAAFDVARTFSNLGFDLAAQRAEDRKNAELEAVRQEFAGKLEQAQGNAQAEEALLQEQANREREIEVKAAEQKKALAITQAVINGALAALQTIANLGFPAAIPALVAVAAVTAANIATIASQKFARGGLASLPDQVVKFDGGGIAPGKPHSQGGTPAVIGGQKVVEIERNEGIVNAKSTGRFLQTLSDINQAEGGVRFPGTAPVTSDRVRQLDAFEMLTSSVPLFARGGLVPRLSPSVRRTFQTGGVASVQDVSAALNREVQFQGAILTEQDVRAIAKAAAEGTKQGIEQANLFGQFRRQAEREISQENRSQI